MFLESFIALKISRNVPPMLTTVTLTPTVPTPKDHSTAHVTMVTLEMESRVMVSTIQPTNTFIKCPGGGDSHMKRTGMLVGNFEKNP